MGFERFFFVFSGSRFSSFLIPASAPASRRRAAARRPETNGASGRPEASLRILETRILRGANYWAREPVIRMLVDLGSLESYPSNLIPGFSDALVGLLPSLDDHACSLGRRGGHALGLRFLIAPRVAPRRRRSCGRARGHAR